MKSLVAQLSALFGERTVRHNLRALAKVIALLVILITLFAATF